MPQITTYVTVGLICGGRSAERRISLNSARSVLDHIQGDDLHVSCYYIDCDLNACAISSAQVYSNTLADFDFKLERLVMDLILRACPEAVDRSLEEKLIARQLYKEREKFSALETIGAMTKELGKSLEENGFGGIQDCLSFLSKSHGKGIKHGSASNSYTIRR